MDTRGTRAPAFGTNKSYKDFVDKGVISDINTALNDDYFSLFLADVTVSYIDFLDKNGFKDLHKSQLISMAAQKIDAGYIKYWKDFGYNHITVAELALLKSSKADAGYADSIKALGYISLTASQLASLKAQGITIDYIKQIEAVAGKIKGLRKLKLEEFISLKTGCVDSAYFSKFASTSFKINYPLVLLRFKINGITPEFIKGFDAAGLTDLQEMLIFQLQMLGITPDLIVKYKMMGYSDEEIEKLINLKKDGITPDFVIAFVPLGFRNMPALYLGKVASSKLTPDDVKKYEDLGFLPVDESEEELMGYRPKTERTKIPNLSLTISDMASFKEKNVTPEYVKSLMEIGYKNSSLSLAEYASLRHANITSDYIIGFNKLGFNNIPVSQLLLVKKNGITPDFVEAMEQKGYRSKELQKYVQLKNGDNMPWP